MTVVQKKSSAVASVKAASITTTTTTKTKTKTKSHHGFIRTAILLGVLSVAVPLVLAFLLTFVIAGPEFYKPSTGLKKHLPPPMLNNNNNNNNEMNPFWKKYVLYHNDPLTDLNIAHENVEFPSVDSSLMLRGWFIDSAKAPEANRPGIVLCHGAYSDMREMLRHAKYLHEEGYPLLLIDVRDHGISDGFKRGSSLSVREHADISSAVAYLKSQRNVKRVAVFGTSNGAASAILAAGKDPNIDAVIAENPYARRVEALRYAITSAVRGDGWGSEKGGPLVAAIKSAGALVPDAFIELVVHMSLFRMGAYDDAVARAAQKILSAASASVGKSGTNFTSWLSRLVNEIVDVVSVWRWWKQLDDAIDVVHAISPRPLLIIHGTADKIVPFDHSQRLFAAAGEPKYFWEVEGGQHGSMVNTHPEEYRKRVLGFLREHMPLVVVA